MLAFITGSRAYGTVRSDSDVDVVVFMSEQDCTALQRLADVNDSADRENLSAQHAAGFTSMRFGKLNLLVCSDVDAYSAWLFGTEEMKKRRPVERSTAVEAFKELRERLAVKPKVEEAKLMKLVKEEAP